MKYFNRGLFSRSAGTTHFRESSVFQINIYVSPLADCRQRDLLVLRAVVHAKRQTRHEPILRADT